MSDTQANPLVTAHRLVSDMRQQADGEFKAKLDELDRLLTVAQRQGEGQDAEALRQTIEHLVTENAKFVSVMVHEIRVPMTSIRGYSDMLSKNVVGELQSVFKYSSYQLINTDKMRLGLNQTGSSPLPGKRVLKVTPLRIMEKRVEMRLVILRKKKQLFQTVVQLLNGGSIIVGGPKHNGGYLLFKISGSY